MKLQRYIESATQTETMTHLDSLAAENAIRHIKLDRLPRTVDSLSGEVNHLTERVGAVEATAQSATQEREALLYMTCALYRVNFPGSPAPQDCAEARRR